MRGALQLAEQKYHQLKAISYQVESANKNVEVVKYSKLPSLDASYQLNIATANNITGLFFPTGILPMTGPPSFKNNYAPVTGSAASLLLNWQAITFGQQNTQIKVAASQALSEKARFQEELFKTKIQVISTYLDLLLDYDLVAIQDQNIHRTQFILDQSRVLANNGIRPGLDTALFLSELSKAKVEWLRSRQQLQTRQLLLAQLLVLDVLPVPADSSFLNLLPTIPSYSDSTFNNHPFVQFAQSQLEVNKWKEQLLKKSYLPKLTVFGIAFARGSGVLADGRTKFSEGISFSRYNYGTGVQLIFPILKYGEVKRQMLVQNFLSKSSEELILQSKTELTAQQRIANTTFFSSLSVAEETEHQLRSALYAFNAMQTRYSTGLVSLSDVIQVQFNLLQAELEVKKSHWDAWKALLLYASIRGDINFFLNEIR
ncbi:MAG: TolC family protein [Flavisolibacter sp.]